MERKKERTKETRKERKKERKKGEREEKRDHHRLLITVISIASELLVHLPGKRVAFAEVLNDGT